MNKNANSSRTGIVIAIVVLILIVSAGAWYLFVYKPEQEAKEKARLEQLAKEEAEEKRKELEAQKKTKYEKLIEDANAAYEQENLENALYLYTEAQSIFPDEPYPQEQLNLVNEKLDEIAAIEARKAAGVVETVSSSTGRYYVVISSSVDGDLAMDYASKLAKEGTEVKIIEPNDTNKLFHRVSVGDYDSWDRALAAAESLTGYDSSAWVLRF